MSTWAEKEAMERSTACSIFSRVFGRVWTPGMLTAASDSRAAMSAVSTGRTTYMGCSSFILLNPVRQGQTQGSDPDMRPLRVRGPTLGSYPGLPGLGLGQLSNRQADDAIRFIDLRIRHDQRRCQAHHVGAGDQDHQAL